MRPSVASRVTRAQARQKAGHDKMSQDRQFTLLTKPSSPTNGEGDSVFVRNFAAGPMWVAGSITAECEPRSFDVELGDGRVVKCHIDPVRSRAVAPPGDNPASIGYSIALYISTHQACGRSESQCTPSDLTAQVNAYSQISRLLHSVTGHAPS